MENPHGLLCDLYFPLGIFALPGGADDCQNPPALVWRDVSGLVHGGTFLSSAAYGWLCLCRLVAPQDTPPGNHSPGIVGRVAGFDGCSGLCLEIAHYALGQLEAAGHGFTYMGDLQAAFYFGWPAIFLAILQ